MYTRIEDFAAEWEKEAQLTQDVLNVLTDESLSQPIAPGRRTLGRLAWHLVSSVQYMTALGLEFEGVKNEQRVPDAAAEIAAEYRRIAAALLQAVQAQWSDDSLRESRAIMGEEWENGASLRFTILHQAHHRGQLTVLMRQAGLRPPGVYGPTYEDWEEKGVTPLS